MRPKTLRNAFLPLIFFFGFFGSYLAQTSVGTFTTVDAFYHSAQSVAYYTNETIPYPFFSNFTRYPADIWYGYHYALGLISTLSPDVGPESYFNDSYFFHSLLTASMLTLLLHLCLVFNRQYRSSYTGTFSTLTVTDKGSAVPVILVFLLLAWLIVLTLPEVTIRLGITQRPHILMLILVLLGILAILKQRPVWLLPLAFLGPLIYSFSVFIWLPTAILLIGWLVVSRTGSTVTVFLKPFLYTLVGYVLGTLFHPNSLGYVINGIGFSSYAIVQTIFSWASPDFSYQSVPSEMQPFDISGLSIIVIVTSILVCASIGQYRPVRQSKAISNEYTALVHIGLLIVSAVLLLGTFSVSRLSEYAIPVALIPLTTILAVLLPDGYQRIRDKFLKHKASSVVKSLSIGLFVLIMSCIALVSLVTIPPLYRYHLDTTNFEYDRYAGAAKFLTSEERSGVILPVLHDMYGQLVFWGRYSCDTLGACEKPIATGMDIRKLHFYDGELSQQLTKIIGHRKECYLQFICGVDSEIAYKILQERDVTYIIFDRQINPLNQTNYLTEYDFLKVAYTDQKYPGITVYEVAPDWLPSD